MCLSDVPRLELVRQAAGGKELEEWKEGIMGKLRTVLGLMRGKDNPLISLVVVLQAEGWDVGKERPLAGKIDTRRRRET